MLIQVENLSYTYSPGTSLARPALRDVNLEIGPGERVGILGRTGSGKSTLALHLAGLLEPLSGRVLLDGVPAHENTAKARTRRRQIGMAFQYPEEQIFEQTVFREVAFGPRNMGLEEAEVAVRVRWALEMAGLNPADVESRVPFTLSGGEMRRVALAGAFALRPQVLIMDEPTAGLDPRGRRELASQVMAWQAHREQSRGKETRPTLILVSHNLDELARLVDRVVLLEEGRAIADGPARQILSDCDLLRAAGLDVPQTVALLCALQEAGWQIRTDRLLPEEAAGEIRRVLAHG